MATRTDICGIAARTALLLPLIFLCPAWAADQTAPQPDSQPKYTFRYKFEPNQLLRWKVVHRCRVRTTVSGSTQTAETISTSGKLWRIKEVRADGSATFEHLVEWVDMRQQLTGCSALHYDSRRDLVAPPASSILPSRWASRFRWSPWTPRGRSCIGSGFR